MKCPDIEWLKKAGLSEEQIKHAQEFFRQIELRNLAEADALIDAGWKFEPVSPDSDVWQWAWRRPPRRKGSKGMRFASTSQAYNHLMRNKR